MYDKVFTQKSKVREPIGAIPYKRNEYSKDITLSSGIIQQQRLDREEKLYKCGRTFIQTSQFPKYWNINL